MADAPPRAAPMIVQLLMLLLSWTAVQSAPPCAWESSVVLGSKVMSLVGVATLQLQGMGGEAVGVGQVMVGVGSKVMSLVGVATLQLQEMGGAVVGVGQVMVGQVAVVGGVVGGDSLTRFQ